MGGFTKQILTVFCIHFNLLDTQGKTFRLTLLRNKNCPNWQSEPQLHQPNKKNHSSKSLKVTQTTQNFAAEF